MSKKLLIMLSITFMFLICLVLGRHYYSVESASLKINGQNLVFNCMSNNYQVIKKEIDDKYIIIMNDAITQSKKQYKELVNNLLGEEYSKLIKVINENKEYIRSERELFYKTQEYVSAKQKLNDCKTEYEKDDCEENKINFHNALNSLSTLNTTINNRLKAKRDEIESAKSKLYALFDKNKKDLIKIRNDVKKDLQTKVIEIFKEYQFVVKELNESYKTNEEIDVSIFTSKISDESVFSSYENDYFNKDADITKAVFSKPITNIN